MPSRIYVHTFAVEGAGDFPLDMLRYDSAWPKSESDSAAMERNYERRRVVLESINESAPSTDRWESFRWNVVPAEVRDVIHGREPHAIRFTPRD